MLNNKSFRLLLCLISGLLLAAGWSDYHTGYATFFGFVPLLIVAERYRNQNIPGANPAVFFYAWFTFFIFNIVSTWWIWNSTEFGAIMAIVCNSLFMAVVFWIFFVITRRLGLRTGLWALIILWLGFEHLHMRWDLSWSWLTLGNSMSGNTGFIQWYEYTGVYGGSVWILLVNIFIFLALQNAISGDKKASVSWFTASAALIAIPVFISLTIYHTYEEKGKPIEIIVVQPNIDPYNEKFGGMSPKEQLEKFTSLAEKKITVNTKYVIGPETALPQGLWEESLTEQQEFRYLVSFAKAFPQITIVTGLSSYREFLPGQPLTPTARKFKNEPGYYESYNTAIHFDSSGIPEFYHKSKLVLGVEKMPFPKTLSFLGKLAIDLGGTSGGLGTSPEPVVFTPRDKAFRPAPVICYESVYGEFVTEYIKKGANLIFVITNDGWWGDTPGHLQHLRFSSLRAIENRRSVARSANTGISCFINQRGDIISPTKYWVPDAVNGTILANNEKTFYTRHGDYIGRAASWLSVMLLIYYFVMRILKKQQHTI